MPIVGDNGVLCPPSPLDNAVNVLQVCRTVNYVNIGLANRLKVWFSFSLSAHCCFHHFQSEASHPLGQSVNEMLEGEVGMHDVGMLDTVTEGGWRGRLFERGNMDADSAGPSTTRVAYEETPRLLRLKFPSSSGKKAVPSRSSLSHVFGRIDRH